MRWWLLLLFPMAVAIAACSTPGSEFTPTTTTLAWQPVAPVCVAAGESGRCALPDYPDRPYEVHVPIGYQPAAPIPLVIAFHGGGGNSESAARVTCPGGRLSAPQCLHHLGQQEGFATLYPNGKGFFPFPNVRTWNAGGDGQEWNCTSGRACQEGVDDVSYVNALLDHVGSWLRVDPSRVYAVGLSNGAALSHRLGCELGEQLAAVAAVGGTNQYSTSADCLSQRSLPVLQIHGTQDPCWAYETSDQACADRGGDKLGAAESTNAWAIRNGCTVGPERSLIPDTAEDGTTTTRLRWYGCENEAEVVLLRIDGGGHAWPNGYQYAPVGRIGRVTRDWGTEVVWEFLSRFSLF